MQEEGTVVGGRYRLIRQVGEGGMATIWKAEHLTLHSPVAVKFLHTGGRHSNETTQRFMREARAAAHVRHRNVIEITDFGLTDDNLPYMVMEYLHGRSLADLMEDNPTLEPEEAVRIVSLTLRGLAAAHDAGIVHRDLKPENIFLVEDADGVFPKLLDFGVARRLGLASDITQEGALIGTPDYMSPEQARGDRDIDRRTDIYSMGVILYETITGRLPFEAERLGDIIRKITTETPPTVHQLRPDLPEALSDVVAKAMSRDREERYPDARQMRYALIDAAEVYGFRHTNSALISVSELPPPPTADEPGQEKKHPTGDVTLPRPGRTPSQPLPTMGDEPTHPATRVLEEDDRNSAAHAATVEVPPTRSSHIPLYVLLVVLVLGAAGSWVYLGGDWSPASLAGDGAAADPMAVPEGPQPWVPQSPGLPPGVLDAGTEDAGEEVHVVLDNLPEGAEVRVDGIATDVTTNTSREITLPSFDHEYVIEVRSADGEVLWRVNHPADRSARYIVWPMSEAEIPDAEDSPEPAHGGRGTGRQPR